MKFTKLFLTCPIFYANARPHLGHAYTLFLADAWARYARLRGSSSLLPFARPAHKSRLKSFAKSQLPVQTCLTTGTDEHGTKVCQAAANNGQSPLDYCNYISPLFKKLCDSNAVEISDFIRTTGSIHERAVEDFWLRLEGAGCLYRSTYGGWYSAIDEAFYADRELIPSPSVDQTTVTLPDGFNTQKYIASETGNAVEWIEEENFLFRLTQFKDPLHKWLDSGVFLVNSNSQAKYLNEAHNMVDCAQDISVSRSRDRLSWGIPVPNHSDQVIYVWLDALVNYLTATGFPWPKMKPSPDAIPWPPDFQFFGNDILRFHAVLWPALLMAVDLPLPRHLVCHHHLMVNGAKMSKSKQNIVDPFDEKVALTSAQENFGNADSEGLRYVLLRSALLSDTASYSRSTAKQMINTELVNCLGNLLSRVTSERVNPNQSIVRITREEAGALFSTDSADAELLDSLDKLAERVDDCWWSRAQPHLAIDHILHTLRQTNALVDRHKPWDKSAPIEPEFVISFATEALRLAGLLLEPVVPKLSKRLLRRLGVYKEHGVVSEEPPQSKYFWELGTDRRPLLHRLL